MSDEEQEENREASSKSPSSVFSNAVLILYFLVFTGFFGINILFLTYLLRNAGFFVFTKIVYDFNTIYVPPVMLAAAGIGLGVARNRDRKRRRWMRGWACVWTIAGVVLMLTRIWATHIEPSLLSVKRVSLDSEKLKKPLRILHMTDIQSSAVGAYEERAFAMAADLQPDLIVYTGDMVQPLPPNTYASELPKIAALWWRMNPPLGKFVVSGDTDEPTSLENLGGLRLLHGTEATIDAGGTKIRLLGLTLFESRYPFDENVKKKIAEWAGRADPGDFSLLIGHAPDFAMTAQNYPIDLCLAGHTHGGQIRVPGYGPIITMSGVPRDWARGWRKTGNPWLNVSAGIGGEHLAGLPTIRFNCPPEMTFIDVLPKDPGS